MAKRTLQSLIRDEGGAVATTYALALVGMIAVAGIGFDFARVATLDTELQNAADQAALAAATQLDGTATAITRATAQASGLVSNQAIMATGNDATVGVASLTFYRTRADAEAGTNATTVPADAHFVSVSIAARATDYALTPIVGVLTSGNINAYATAGLGSAVCKVPPVMMCNPAVNPAVADISTLIGKGILLKATGGGGAWAPGDFGFLDVGAGANDLAKLMGYANPPGNCVDVQQTTTEPGAMMSVIRTFNTRFDIYENGDGNINCYSDGLCPASDNARKDVVQAVTGGGSSSGGNNGNGNNGDGNGGGGGGGGGSLALSQNDCGLSNGSNPGWRVSLNAYRPLTANVCSATNPCGAAGATYPDVMGYPRDLNQATSDTAALANRIGSGIWDVNAYFQANYGRAYANDVNGKLQPTRYEVYDWERSNRPGTAPYYTRDAGTGYRQYWAPACRPGAPPGPNTVDRRVLPLAIVNCTGLNGKANVVPLKWAEAFLVEPSLDRSGHGRNYTQRGDIFVEIIGEANQGIGGTANQYVRRDKPYLLK